MAIEFKDYYAALGVKKDASPDEVKQAYRRLAKLHHPDLHHEKDKAGAEKRFKEANEAYEVLSDPQKRAKYDSLGPGWEAQQPPEAPERERPSESFDGFSDFFETLFRQQGGHGFGGGSASETGPRKGQDVEAELPLSLEDSIHGGDKTLSMLVAALCPSCRGSGRHGSRFCPACAGVGETKEPRSITAHLPKLVRDGTKLRLRGQGEPAPRGGQAGDLFLRIRLLPHPVFTVSGSDLETTVTVMPWDAALGGEAEVPTLEGPLRVRFPAQTHAGRRLRVAGKGLGKDGGGRGDLYASVRIDIPERADAALERLYKELREAGR